MTLREHLGPRRTRCVRRGQLLQPLEPQRSVRGALIRVGAELRHDERCGVEEGSDEEVLKGDLSLGLDACVGVLDDRDREGEAEFEGRLVVPFVEKRRGPVLGDLDGSGLEGRDT